MGNFIVLFLNNVVLFMLGTVALILLIGWTFEHFKGSRDKDAAVYVLKVQTTACSVTMGVENLLEAQQYLHCFNKATVHKAVLYVADTDEVFAEADENLILRIKP